MEKSPSCESKKSSPSQKSPCVLWNPEVHYCTHKSPLCIPVPRQINQVHASPFHFLSIYFNIIFPQCLSLPSGLFLSGLSTKTLYANLLYPTRATCLTHLILLNLIPRIIFTEEYRPRRSSLCSLLHSPVKSCLLGTNIFLSTLCSKTLGLCSSRSVRDETSHPYNKLTKLEFCIF